MEQSLIAIILGVLGLQLGSFACAMVWRLRANQLEQDKKAGEDYDTKEYKTLRKLSHVKVSEDRSRCLSCSHQLAWYDLIPLVSWLQLKGNCRYCKSPIGRLEPLAEAGTAAFFVIAYLVWPQPLADITSIALFGLWLVAGLGLIILFIYDFKWLLLPNKIMFPVIGVATLSALGTILSAEVPFVALIDAALGVVVLSGLYLLLYVVSRGAWVGFGDVKLGLALALLLADWRLALLTVFLANIIGCIVVIPALLTKKMKRAEHVPFGPMLIAAWFIVTLYGQQIIEWYSRLIIGY